MKTTLAKWIDETARRLAFAAHLAASLSVLLPLTAGGTLALVWLCRETFCDTTVDQRNLNRFIVDTPSVACIAALFFMVALFVLMHFAFKLLRSWIFPKDATFIPSGRVSSALKGFGLGLSVLLCLQILFCLRGNLFNSHGFLWMTLALTGCAALVGACHPLAREPRRRLWIVTSIFYFLPLHVAASFAIKWIPIKTTYHSRFVCDLRHGTKWTNQILPRTAENVFVKADFWMFLGNSTWMCTVDEKDFMKFAQENGYALKTEMNSAGCLPMPRELPLPDKRNPPESVYIHDGRDAGGSGFFLLYDRTDHILYGYFSSH